MNRNYKYIQYISESVRYFNFYLYTITITWLTQITQHMTNPSLLVCIDEPNPHPLLCRICLEQTNQNVEQKHFISPCACKGTAKNVHYQCLQKWIKKSLWKHTKDKNGTYFKCQSCNQNIYFTIGSESWLSWVKTKPCSAVFYLSWIILLLISFISIVTLVIYSVVTAQYELMRFLGLPLGFFLFGGFLFLQCGKDFRDYETGIVHIKENLQLSRKSNQSQKQRKDSEHSLNVNNL